MRIATTLTCIFVLCASLLVLYCGCESVAEQARIESRDKWINDTISRLETGQTEVALYSCSNTDFMLEMIAGMEQVESVYFQQTIDLTDDGLRFLPTLPNLKELEFSGEPSLTNDSLAIISKCEQLKFLSLKLTGVTDPGLDAMSKMTHLELFDHYGQFSSEAIESLSKKLPNLEIIDRDAWLKSPANK